MRDPRRPELVAVLVVVALRPARAEPEDDPPVAHVVDRPGDVGEQVRVAVRVAGDERPELDALGRLGPRREQRPALEVRPGPVAVQRIEVVPGVEHVVAELFAPGRPRGGCRDSRRAGDGAGRRCGSGAWGPPGSRAGAPSSTFPQGESQGVCWRRVPDRRVRRASAACRPRCCATGTSSSCSGRSGSTRRRLPLLLAGPAARAAADPRPARCGRRRSPRSASSSTAARTSGDVLDRRRAELERERRRGRAAAPALEITVAMDADGADVVDAGRRRSRRDLCRRSLGRTISGRPSTSSRRTFATSAAGRLAHPAPSPARAGGPSRRGVRPRHGTGPADSARSATGGCRACRAATIIHRGSYGGARHGPSGARAMGRRRPASDAAGPLRILYLQFGAEPELRVPPAISSIATPTS